MSKFGDEPVFRSKFFVANRLALRSSFGGSAPIVIAGNGLLQKSLDATYPFHQDSNFWYLTGATDPGLTLVMEKNKEYIILPKQSEYMRVFDGSVDEAAIQKISGIDTVLEYEKGWTRLSRKLRKSKHVAGITPPEEFIEDLDMYTNPARARVQRLILETNPDLRFIDLKSELASLRVIKQPAEIAAIEHATEETMKAFVAMSEAMKTAKTENEIEAIATGSFIRRGLEHAYTPIVAAGGNATTLHYVSNRDKVSDEELVLIDMGAVSHHYASDVTRTLARNPTKRQRAVHDAVREVLEYAVGVVKPGLEFEAFEADVRQHLGEKLQKLGLIDTIDRESVRKYYPHATSHCVGLDVHDPSPEDGAMHPGMVLTIEPGIYIESEKIGVRIEDIVLITEDGVRVLSADLSRGLDSLTIKAHD